MRSLVADASAIVDFLLQVELAASVDRIITQPDVDIRVPGLCDIEVCNALRKSVRLKAISPAQAEIVLGQYRDLPITRHPHPILLERILELRDNFTAYDATYVALAEILDAELLTTDDKLARSARRIIGQKVIAI